MLERGRADWVPPGGTARARPPRPARRPVDRRNRQPVRWLSRAARSSGGGRRDGPDLAHMQRDLSARTGAVPARASPPLAVGQQFGTLQRRVGALAAPRGAVGASVAPSAAVGAVCGSASPRLAARVARRRPAQPPWRRSHLSWCESSASRCRPRRVCRVVTFAPAPQLRAALVSAALAGARRFRSQCHVARGPLFTWCLGPVLRARLWGVGRLVSSCCLSTRCTRRPASRAGAERRRRCWTTSAVGRRRSPVQACE